MRDLILIAVSGYIGWYLANNEKEATLRTLEQVKTKANQIKDELSREIQKNEKLTTLLDGISLRQGFDGATTDLTDRIPVERYKKPRIKRVREREI
tara:strand:+ start:50 stop:337 length:288 start_codon:yes stop_codon:yes gene_type:complete